MNILEKIKKLSVENIKELSGKKVLLRIDVNVSLGDNGTVDKGEDWRIIKSLPTIQFLREAGASVILIAHIGRKKEESLKPVFTYMQQFFTLGFLPYFEKEKVEDYISSMGKSSVVLMENLRRFDGEKENDSSYLDGIIDLCDFYVNDAFSVSHREHASLCDITKKLPAYFGLQFINEVDHLLHFLNIEKGTKTLVLGGAKFGTKFSLLKKMLPKLDYVLMGGALANVFLKERGFFIGKSFYDAKVDVSSMRDNTKIVLPIDYIDEHGDLASIDNVSEENQILDIGPATGKLFEEIIDHSSSLMWNGPMGKYEDNYVEGSLMVADSIAHSEVFSLVGGGDTSTVILENNLEENFSFISTGGGAMLQFLVDETLPAIEAILLKNIN